MKVQIQNHTIEFTKENSEWAIKNHPPLTLFPQGNQTILLQTTNQTIQVRCIGVDRSAKTVTLL